MTVVNLQYVVAFNRARDSYQVPLALKQAGLLDTLVTDVGRTTSRLLKPVLPSRPDIEFPARSTWTALARQAPRFRRKRASTNFYAVDDAISRHAGRIARRHRSSVFFYSGYARFMDRLVDSAPARILFVFHPSPDRIRAILESDLEQFPMLAKCWGNDADVRDTELRLQRLQHEIAAATHLVVASSFTARSLETAPRRSTSVIPYGASSTSQDARRTESSRPCFVFVGQGVQRKGLHHLFTVWPSFAAEADLFVVATHLEPEIARLAPETVHLLPRQSQAGLEAIWQRADALILPSLVEGFGLVITEALSRGCAVIATQNTGLPDLNLPEHVGLITDAGDLDTLRYQISQVIRMKKARQLSRNDSATSVKAFSWSRFRSDIGRTALAAISPNSPPAN